MSHSDLASGRWHTLTLMEQLGDAGSAISRALRARASGSTQHERAALNRFLELINLTIADPRRRGRRRELCRTREVVCDFFVGDNVHRSTPDSLDHYFLAFATAARRQH